MRLSSLVWRNMWSNMRNYYLYFYALIFSVMLYFIFSTLQYDNNIGAAIQSSESVSTAFQTGVIFLAVIMLVFVLYAKSLFYKRRGREIGVYQLIGLSRAAVLRMLLLENTMLLAGAAAAGIGLGLLFARLFLLLFLKLLRLEMPAGFTFAPEALLQTAAMIGLLLLVTSVQTIRTIMRHSLAELFQANASGEGGRPVYKLRQTATALLGLLLVGFGYWLSGRMLNALLLLNMLAVLFSTILGTYLLFRVTISWLLGVVRARANGHLSFANALSLAPLMHRMRANARLLTLITTLSAITLTLVTAAYSLYYSSEQATRQGYPQDFLFEAGTADAQLAAFRKQLAAAGIAYEETVLDTYTEYVRVSGFDEGFGQMTSHLRVTFMKAEQLQAAGIEAEPGDLYKTLISNTAALAPDAQVFVGELVLPLTQLHNRHALSSELTSGVVAMEEQVFVQLAAQAGQSTQAAALSAPEAQEQQAKHVQQGEHEHQAEQIDPVEQAERIASPAPGSQLGGKLNRFHAIQVAGAREREQANALYHEAYEAVNNGAQRLQTNTDQTRQAIETSGLLIFIAGFLGIVFLAATGSILYFKQMTEIEDEKPVYRTLRQLGFTVDQLLKGVGRKQLLFFLLPLLIGLVHCYFAIQSIIFLYRTDITVPVLISVSVYGLIYTFFFLLSFVNSRYAISAVK